MPSALRLRWSAIRSKRRRNSAGVEVLPLQREEVRDEIVDLAIVEIDVGVAQQRREVVGVGPRRASWKSMMYRLPSCSIRLRL